MKRCLLLVSSIGGRWYRTCTALAQAVLGISALLCLLIVVLSSCSVEDERDECCDGVLLLYRSVPINKDLFRKHIQEDSGLRHFLFDAKGVFVKEVRSNPKHPQKLRLRRLDAGRYTMVTLANASQERTQFTNLEPRKSLLSQFMLRVLPEGVKGLSDELFWNVRSFEVQRGVLRTYYCDLANIHCQLTVRVKWEGVPPDATTAHYSMELQRVSEGYPVHPPFRNEILVLRDESEQDASASTLNQVVHHFPLLADDGATYRLDAPMTQLELEERFTTLRYTNETIPILRILKDGVLYRKEIDLRKAFRNWGLFPDKHVEQDYRILIEMKRDGRMILHHWTDFRIVDWADGGTLGGSV